MAQVLSPKHGARDVFGCGCALDQLDTQSLHVSRSRSGGLALLLIFCEVQGGGPQPLELAPCGGTRSRWSPGRQPA